MYETNMAELQGLNQMLRDEHQALQIAFAAIEEKLRKAQVFYCLILMSSKSTIDMLINFNICLLFVSLIYLDNFAVLQLKLSI